MERNQAGLTGLDGVSIQLTVGEMFSIREGLVFILRAGSGSDLNQTRRLINFFNDQLDALTYEKKEGN